MSIYDPTYPEDHDGPECPIEALADALRDAYRDGLYRRFPSDRTEQADKLAREFRSGDHDAVRAGALREGWLAAVAEFRRYFMDEVADAVEAKAPGEGE